MNGDKMFSFISNPYPYNDYPSTLSDLIPYILLAIVLITIFKLSLMYFKEREDDSLDFYDAVDRYCILNFCLEGIEQIEVLENEE